MKKQCMPLTLRLLLPQALLMEGDAKASAEALNALNFRLPKQKSTPNPKSNSNPESNLASDPSTMVAATTAASATSASGNSDFLNSKLRVNKRLFEPVQTVKARGTHAGKFQRVHLRQEPLPRQARVAKLIAAGDY